MKGKMFKYIFSFLLLLVVLSGNSQTINGRLYTQFNNYYKWRGGAFDSVLLLPNVTATAGLRGGALRYNGADSSLYVWSGFQWRKIDGSGGSTPNLQQVTAQGNTTTDTVTVGGLQIPLLSSTAFFKSLPTSGPNNIVLTGTMGRPTLSLGTTISNTAFVSPLFTLTNNTNGYNASIVGTVTNYNTITVPDSSGTLPLRIKLNSTTYSATNNGTIDLGTIAQIDTTSLSNRINLKLNISDTASMLSPYLRKFDTASLSNRINLKLNISDTANMLSPYLRSNVAAATYQPIGNYLTTGSSGSLQNLTITGTNGNGHIHLRHQASLPTATGQSTVIYANSNGDFAYKNDGNHHTTFVTSANTADRSYTFQNKNYTVADNAEVVKYTDTSAMLSPYQLTTVANSTYQLQLDTVPVASFGAGSGAAGDTAAFSTSAVYGSFYNDGSDTLIITQMRAGVLGTSPSITTEIYWNDSLNITAGATILVSGGTSVTGTIGATNVTSFTNNKIPPGNWVFCRTSAVATKPTYFTLTLLGYKKRK